MRVVRGIVNKGQLTQTVVQLVYAPPTHPKELRVLQVCACSARALLPLLPPAVATC
jgi:hypothetical protein